MRYATTPDSNTLPTMRLLPDSPWFRWPTNPRAHFWYGFTHPGHVYALAAHDLTRMISRTWTKGSTRSWRRTRAMVLARDAGRGCRAHRDGWCAQVPGHRRHTCTDTQDVAHHTRGRAVTGDDMRHLVASCKTCNGYIGNPADHSPMPKKVSRW